MSGYRRLQNVISNIFAAKAQTLSLILPRRIAKVLKMSREGYSHFKYFLVTSTSPSVTHVEINRPSKLNAFYEPMWIEFGQIFDKLSYDSDVRAIVLSGAGEKAFSAGLDVLAASEAGAFSKKGDVARLAVAFRRHVDEFQKCIASVERCEKPVICVLHGYSFGLALDISTCADIRICASNTKFAVKEVEIGLAADIGTLSRLPKVVGNFGWVKDVALSARVFGAEEAYRVGLVNQVHDTKEKALEAGLKMAALLATKSPVAVQSTKELLNHARDHSIAESLRYTGVWNAAATQTSDIEKALLSGIQKRTPTFEKL